MSHQYFGGKPPSLGAGNAKAVIMLSSMVLIFITALALVFAKPAQSRTDTIVVEREGRVEMIDVLVPVQNIDGGTALEPTMFRMTSKARVGFNERMVKSFEEVKGAYARTLIMADQPLYRDYVTAVRPINGVISNIPEGFRAVTIRVDAQSSVEGWARAGARVDVVWRSKIRGKDAVVIIVENAKILSAERQTENEGQQAQAGAPVPSTVTLLVTADDANRIQLASTAGSMTLSLRGDRDTKSSSGGALTVDDLLKNENSDAPLAPRSASIKIKESNGEYREYALRGDKLVPTDLFQVP